MEQSSSVVFDKFIQVKMLILFVMSRLPLPVQMKQLTELAMCDERINYFDITECIAKLVSTKHMQLSDGKYSITAKGRRNSEILEEDIPHSVRAKAEDAAMRLGEELKRDSLISSQLIENDNGGKNIRLILSDGVGEILAVELYTSGNEQAAELENGFRRNAHTLYNEIVQLITRREQ